MTSSSARSAPFLLAALVVGAGCGAKAPSEPVNPLGGPVNIGGKPDLEKTNGAASTGGTPNGGGAPDVSKTNGTIGAGGRVNTGGAPDLKKSLPKSRSK